MLRALETQSRFVRRKFLHELRTSAPEVALKKAVAKLNPKPELEPEPSSDDFFLNANLNALPMPFLTVGGRLIKLDGFLGGAEAAGEEAAIIAAASADRVYKRYPDDAGPSSPFWDPTLTPRARVHPAPALESSEALFSRAFAGAEPPPRGVALFSDGSDIADEWEAFLGADASVVRDWAPPKRKKPKKKEAHAREPPALPFLSCYDRVTELKHPPPPLFQRANAAKLLPCKRYVADRDERPFWEHEVAEAPDFLTLNSAPEAPLFDALAILDPLGPLAPVTAQLLVALRDLGANVTVALKPMETSDLTSWTRTSLKGDAVTFGAVQSKGRVFLEVTTPHHWRVDLVTTTGDVDNFEPDAVEGAVEARYDLSAINVIGSSLNLKGTSLKGDVCVDGVVTMNGEFSIPRTDMNASLKVGPKKTQSKPSLRPKALKYQSKYLQNCSYPEPDGQIHVFSVASGKSYERLLRIMMGSVVLKASRPVVFWLLRDFLSPAFVEEAPTLARALGSDVNLLEGPPWPQYLTGREGEKIGIRGDKQRLIWAYKLLFLDNLFLTKTDRIVFVDADQVVLGDLAELVDFELPYAAPYAMVPFCRGEAANPLTKGHRFWEQGFWRDHLGDRPYHISALFVVDLKNFRQHGDAIRQAYRAMGPDANSLSNLDQDLPNYLSAQGVPLASLPDDWLYCEAWCSPESKARAKSIDMCQNPLTKEYKLDMARRVGDPLWTRLDDYMTEAVGGGDLKPIREALAGVGVAHDEL